MFPFKAIAVSFLLFLLLGLGSAVFADQVKTESLTRDEVILRMVQLARSGRIDQAQNVLRNYLQDNTGDGTMHYNLTCLDLLLMQKDQAMIDLENALKNGYTNFRLIEVDADLNRLRDDPRFLPLIEQYQTDFIEDFHSRALYLEEGYPAQKLSLELQSTRGGELKPQVAVAFNARELLLTLTVDETPGESQKPPWENGSGVMVNLVHPVSPDDYDSRRYYSYAFYLNEGQARATLVGRHKEVFLQSIPPLKPTITQQGNTTTYEIAIAWEFFDPYAPSLDPEMGLNVFYFTAGEEATRSVYSLMPEKKMAYQANTWRRYIPVTFLDSDRSTARLRGRLYDRLTEGVELGIQLAFWSEAEGDARCRFSFHPKSNPGTALITDVHEKIFCDPELNFFNFYLNLADLPVGSIILKAEVTDPNGRVFVREFPFDNFKDQWLASLNERVHQLKNTEQSTLMYHLFLLTRLAENRHIQSDASHIHQAYANMVRMIELSESGATCLPDQGLFKSGFATAPMVMRFCTMHLPLGFKDEKDLQLLMVLPPQPQTEDSIAQSIGQTLGDNPNTIVLVPQSHGYSSLDAVTAAKETVLAMKWATELFGEKSLTLVGLGHGADAALGASLLSPDLCNQVLLDGQQLYSDLEELSSATVGEALGDNLNQLPYTMVEGKSISERTQLIQSTMRALGFKIELISLDSDTLDIPWISRWFLAD